MIERVVTRTVGDGIKRIEWQPLGGSPLGKQRRGVATGVPIGVETRLPTEFERTFVRRTKKRCDCNDSDL
jgi:hypothetical protein